MSLLRELKRFVKKGDFVLSSGKKSDFYIDIKEAYTEPKVAKAMGKELGKKIRQLSKTKRIDRIAGPELGAVPLATLASLYSGKPFLMVRKAPKRRHGTKKLVEGRYKKGESCLIIDDVLTTGGSVLRAIRTIKRAGLRASMALVIVDREDGGKEALEKRGIRTHSLYTRSSLLS